MASASSHRASGTRAGQYSARKQGQSRNVAPVRATRGPVLTTSSGMDKVSLQRDIAHGGRSSAGSALGSGYNTRMEKTPSSQITSGNALGTVETFAIDETAMERGKTDGVKLVSSQRGKNTNNDDRFPDVERAACTDKLQPRNLKLGSRRVEGASDSPAVIKAYEALVEKQKTKLGGILRQLQTQKRKTSCWAWWVFPTEKQGNCDPAATRVTKSTAPLLLNNASTVHMWQKVLEIICDLIEEHGKTILPRIDHGRVHWFIKFWADLEASPDWMKSVCSRLGSFDWPKV